MAFDVLNAFKIAIDREIFIDDRSIEEQQLLIIDWIRYSICSNKLEILDIIISDKRVNLKILFIDSLIYKTIINKCLEEVNSDYVKIICSLANEVARIYPQVNSANIDNFNNLISEDYKIKLALILGG